jgi:drug/metabolite transporter (DMT)-like permease
MAIILGLLAAISWGAADFLARYATRLIGTYRTLFFMQFFGLVGLGIYLQISGTFSQLINSHHWQAWTWALLAALLNCLCNLALYRAFEVGVLTVVSPIAASSSALTVVLSFLSGELVSHSQAIGIAASLIGVVLAATSFTPEIVTLPDAAIDGLVTRKKRGLTRGVGWALVSSVGYGVLFWLLGFYVTPALGGLFPIWLVRLVSICTLALFAVPTRQNITLPRGTIWWLLASVGILDTVAFTSAAIGLTTGQVAIVSVIAALFSTVTVVLAWIFLREKLYWSQWLGICIIFVGLVFVNF